MVMLPFGDFRPDTSDFNAAYTQRVLNVVPRADGYGPFKDIETFTRALPAGSRGYFFAKAEDRTVRIFAGTATKLYLLNNTTLAFEDVSKSAGSYTTISEDANWSFAQFNNLVVATQKNDDIQVFNIASDTAFDDLGGNPPRAGWIATVARFLVIVDLADDPFDIAWCGLNETDNWAPGVNGSDQQTLPDQGSPLAVVEISGDVGLILQETGARRMVFSPGSPIVFQISRLENVPGILAPGSAVVSTGGCYYLSPRGFVLVDSAGGFAPIGEERVNRTFLGLLPTTAPSALRRLAYDANEPRLVMGAADPRQNLVLFVYKSVSGAADLFDRGLLYHTTLKRWAPLEITGECIASVARPGLTMEGLDAIAPGALTITGAANNGGGLIRLAVASTATLADGQYKTISGVGGTTEANGTWVIDVINATHFDLIGSAFLNVYVSGGVVAGSLDDLPFSLDSVSSAALPALSIIDTTRMLGFFDGDPLEAELMTSEQSLGGRMNINGLRPITDAAAAFCSTITRGNLNEVETAGTESEMDDDGNCPVLDEGRYARGLLRIPAGTSWSFASGIEPDASRAGDF